MSCRRAYEIDLAAFLAEPRNTAHADFREHYPRCAACAAEVRAWTELEGLLRAPEVHPAPEKLLALHDAREALAPVERAALEEHVAGCPSCRDELEALRGFTPHAHEAAPDRGSALGSFVAGIRSLLVQPAFAYALVLLFAAPTLYRLVTSESDLLRDVPIERALEERVAQAPEPPAANEESQVEERKDDDARDAAAKAKPARGQADPAHRSEEAASAETSPPFPQSVELRERPAKVEAEAETAGPAEVALAPIYKEQLRALGYVDAPAAPPHASGATADKKARQSARPAQAPTAPPAPAAESFAAGSRLSADAAVATDALEAEGVGRAGAPLPVFESGAQGVHRLRVPLEPGMGEVEVRVSPPGGGRMLAEHFRGAADEVVLEIPSVWMTPGRWRIERRALGRRDVFEVEVP